MTVEITGHAVTAEAVYLYAEDVSDLQLQRLERVRDDISCREIRYIFHQDDRKDREYLCKWLKRQRATKGCHTFGEALRAVHGTHTTIASKYRDWDQE